MKKKAYLSKSNKADFNTFAKVRATLEQKQFEVIEYKGGTKYDPDALIKPVQLLVVVTHPEGYLKDGTVKLGRGILSEVSYALENNIPVLASNRSGDSFYKISDVNIRPRAEADKDSTSWQFWMGDILLAHENKHLFEDEEMMM